MRIALIIERFGPDAGGVETVAWNAAQGLARDGHEVRVVARVATEAAGLEVLRVPVPRAWQPLRVLAFSRAAARAAPRGDFDIVQSFSRTRHQDVYRAGGGSHADYMTRQYGASGSRWRQLSPRHRVLLAIEGAVLRDPTQRILCNSRMVRDGLAQRAGVDPARLDVVYNGVDLARFHPARRETDGKRVREAEGAPQLVWLLVGSGFERKGVDTALRALALGPPEAALWIAGRDDPAPWRSRARAAGVADRVRFLGPRADPEALYAAADALVLPTRYDAFANACLEAAAAGLPVVTSGANGAAEVLGEGGIRIDRADDAAGFAAALRKLGAPERRRRMGEAARGAAEQLGWETHVRALVSVYESCGANAT